MHRALLLAVLSLSVLFSTLVAAQDASYTFTTIDAPGATLTAALGINTAGQVVGSFYDGTKWHGFVTDGATFTPIDVPGATYTQAYRINDSGQIVGVFSDSSGNLHGFVKDGATFTPHRCPLKRKAAVIGILRPLTLGLSHALLALQEADGGQGWKVGERRGRP